MTVLQNSSVCKEYINSGLHKTELLITFFILYKFNSLYLVHTMSDTVMPQSARYMYA